MEKKDFIKKKPLPQIVPVVRKKANLTTTLENFQRKAKCLLHVQKWKIFIFFERKVFSSRCYFGHLDSKFDNSLETFCQMNKKLRSPNSRKDTGEELFQIIPFSLSCSHEHVDNRFYNMPHKSMEGSWKRFISVLEVVEQTINIKKTTRSVPVDI